MMERPATKRSESVPGRPWWWQWPTILALDAPAVALVWQNILSRVAGVSLKTYHIVLLGLSVWLAYTADRWIEGWRLSSDTVRTQRHYFLLRWRWPAFAVWIAVLAVGIGLAFARLSLREWLASIGLLLPTLLYVLSHQFLHRAHLWRMPKEICVAAIVSLGAALYPATLASDHWHPLVVPTALFMLLCLANCLLVSEWEREVDLRHGQRSFALQFSHTHTVARVLPWVIIVLGIGMAAFFSGPVSTIAYCSIASATLLMTLDRMQPRIGREGARILTDIALLTPLVMRIFT